MGFSWHSRSHRHSWWYGHLWEEQPGTWQTSDQLSGYLQEKYIDMESRQDAVQTSTSLILWTPVECQGAQSRSKEDCSGEKNGFTQRCWQEESHVQAFHNFHPVLATTWKPPEFIKSCLGGSPTTPLPQEPWIWSLDNLSLSRKWMETFGEQPLSSWARFLLGKISRQLHIEKDQINDQAKVSTFSFWASGQSTTEELWRRSQLTFMCNLQPVEWTINVACYTNGKCDQSSNSW